MQQAQARADALHPTHPGTRWVRTSRYHLTLSYLGESDGRREDLIERALAAAGGCRASPFELVLDRLQALGNPRNPALALVASETPTGLHEFHESLRQRLLRAGFQRLGGHLLPHLTLGYASPHPALVPVEPLRLRFAQFCLLLGIEGRAEYEVLGSWPLTAT